MKLQFLAYAGAAALFAACGGGDDGGTADRRQIELPDAMAGLPDAAGPADASLNPAECNTTTQNCGDPVVDKCTIIFNGSTFETECLTPTGTVPESGQCMRVAEGNTGVGHDDCDVGAFCSGVGQDTSVVPTTRYCRKFCDSDPQCSIAGQKCLSFDGSGPLQGFCIPTCNLFTPTDCPVPSTMSCGISLDNNGTDGMGVCRSNGIKTAGNACTASTDCAANLNCADDGSGNGVCTALCDTAHACPTGTTCQAISGMANGGGICQ